MSNPLTIPKAKRRWTDKDLKKWVALHPVGARVRYWPGRSSPEHRDTVIESAPWRLGDGTPLVAIEGVNGGVALDHLRKLPPPGAPPYARLRRTMSEAEWNAEGVRLFGEDRMTWRFVCPSCGHVASVADWKSVGASEGEAAFSCVGRHIAGASDMFGEPPCNYAGGGLFGLNPVTVTREGNRSSDVFAFELVGEKRDVADAEARAQQGRTAGGAA